MVKTRTFRTVSGSKVRITETEEQQAERELLNMVAIVMPVLTILVFALAAGVI